MENKVGNKPAAPKKKRAPRPHKLRWKIATRVLGPVLSVLLRLLWKSLRIKTVIGAEHLEGLDGERAFIPCCWHQLSFACAGYLATRGKSRLGIVISPSRDGEVAARMVAPFKIAIIRGSASRTGAQTLRELHQCISKEGISPFIQPDGPTGPVRHFKEGTLLLAQWTGAPFLPMAYAADRFWQLKSWDRHIVPKPFARIAIAIGKPATVDKKADAATLEETRQMLQSELTSLIDTAKAALP